MRGRSSRPREVEPELKRSGVAAVALDTFDELAVGFCVTAGLLEGWNGFGSGRNGFPLERETGVSVVIAFPHIRFGMENLSSHPSEDDGEPMTTALVEAEP